MSRKPRIDPLKPEELGPDAGDIIAGLLAAQSSKGTTQVPEFIATMLRHRDLFQRQVDMSTQLFKGALPFRDTELVLLRISWLCRAPFVFGQHVQTSKRVCGFTSDDIERIVAGSNAAGWDERSRAILRAAEELHETSSISDATWAQLEAELDEKQLIELPILVGHIHGVAYVQNALQVRLMAGNQGLEAR
jgi:alkylhydroperoxidase family enzyme